MKYFSPTTHEECTAAQLIAEIIITRKYKKKKKSLPFKFWNDPLYKAEFVKEIIAANTLLKVYNEIAVVNAVLRKDTEWMTSLRIKKWKEFIDEEQEKIDLNEKQSQKSTDIVISSTDTMQKNTTKSRLDRLKDF